MEKLTWKKAITALLVALGLTAVHMILHRLLSGITSIWNPVFISVVVGTLFFGVLYAQVEWNHKHIYRWFGFAALVAGLHFATHLLASNLLNVPILNNTVIGAAGTVVLITSFVLELLR